MNKEDPPEFILRVPPLCCSPVLPPNTPRTPCVFHSALGPQYHPPPFPKFGTQITFGRKRIPLTFRFRSAFSTSNGSTGAVPGHPTTFPKLCRSTKAWDNHPLSSASSKEFPPWFPALPATSHSTIKTRIILTALAKDPRRTFPGVQPLTTMRRTAPGCTADAEVRQVFCLGASCTPGLEQAPAGRAWLMGKGGEGAQLGRCWGEGRVCSFQQGCCSQQGELCFSEIEGVVWGRGGGGGGDWDNFPDWKSGRNWESRGRSSENLFRPRRVSFQVLSLRALSLECEMGRPL